MSKLKTLPAKFVPGFLKKLDGRYALAQHLTANYESIVDDLGGIEGLSHTRLTLIERFVFLQAVLENWESQFVNDPESSEALLGRWTQACNACAGLARIIGLDRRQTNVVSLQSYVKSKTEARA